MPIHSKPLTLGRLSDNIHAILAVILHSETLDHAVRFLSTWSGSDKLFMIIQYLAQLVIPLLALRGRVLYRTGSRATPDSEAAKAVGRLGSLVSDSRILWRIWGLLPIFQWLSSLEQTPPPTRRLQIIERLQALTMLFYYPLEHVSYLASHKIISISPRRAARASLWSCRFWAAYVVLQFWHLREDAALLRRRERALAKSASGSGEEDAREIATRWDGIYNELVVNLGYLPLTVHWSLEKGLIANDIIVSMCGLIAAVASFRGGWKATAK